MACSMLCLALYLGLIASIHLQDLHLELLPTSIYGIAVMRFTFPAWHGNLAACLSGGAGLARCTRNRPEGAVS